MPAVKDWRVAFCGAKCVAYGKEKQRNQKERKNLGLSSPFALLHKKLCKYAIVKCGAFNLIRLIANAIIHLPLEKGKALVHRICENVPRH